MNGVRLEGEEERKKRREPQWGEGNGMAMSCRIYAGSPRLFFKFWALIRQ